MTYRMYRGPRRRCVECVEVPSVKQRGRFVRSSERATVLVDDRPVCWEHYNQAVRG